MKCHPWSGGLSSCALALPLSLVPRADAPAPRGARSSAPASRRTDDLARLALLSLLRRFAPACARRPRIRSGWPGASVAATSGLSSPVLTVNSIISAHFQIFFCHRRARIPVYTRGLAIESLPFPKICTNRSCPNAPRAPTSTVRSRARAARRRSSSQCFSVCFSVVSARLHADRGVVAARPTTSRRVWPQ